MIPLVLTIAGSDSGGGAGIQADIKTIQACRGFALSVLTSITAQNTQAVTAAFDLPLEIIESQIDAVFDDFEIGAVKTGMLSSRTIVESVARKLKEKAVGCLVVDPVMISKSGYPLLRDDAVATLRTSLLPLALVTTPNRHEAELLARMTVKSESDVREAGFRILETGCRAVLIKGGHLDEKRSVDYLVTAKGVRAYPSDRITTNTTHGTGCTFSSALATWLAHGLDLEDAVGKAKHYVTEAIRHGLSIGHGHGPTDHFWFLRQGEPYPEGLSH